MKFRRLIISAIVFCILGNTLYAQNTNTLYFMDNIAERNNINPAFTPNCNFYLDFIFLPNLYLNVGTNALTFSDLLYMQNGQPTIPFESKEGIDKLYKALPNSTNVNFNLGLNILSFGFKVKKNYFTFDYGFNANADVYLPKDAFKLAFYGTPNADGINSFDLSTLGIESSLYSKIGVGYMREINKHWTIGFKAKFLMGYANVDTKISNLSLNASRQEWMLQTNGNIYASLPMHYNVNNDGSIDFTEIKLYDTSELIQLLYQPLGYGSAIDFGITYKPIENLTISTSVTDLGFIHWNKNAVSGRMSGEHKMDGFIDYSLGDTVNIGDQITNTFTQLGEEIINSIHTDAHDVAYSTMLKANFYAGVEYGVLKNKISFGAVNRLTFNNRRLQDEVTLALNLRPASWLKATIDYSFIDGNWGNVGFGLNLRAGIFNMYVLADYIPTSYTRLYTEKAKLPIPNRTQRVNLQVGWTWNIGNFETDTDRDGIKGKKDHCPNSDLDFLMAKCPDLKKKQLINKYGCDFDEDKDGIHDCYDQCPNTPLGVEVDSVGCPFDSDKDGVLDHKDICPDTPEGVIVTENGCPVDEDGDGVPDYLDQCPNTPKNIVVDSVGCPIDSDKDGVADYIDICPNTPTEVVVDSLGCPIDTDKDGVADYIDICPNTPLDVAVDENGCPFDADKDGVDDYIDKCPKTPLGALVDEFGCPIDSDKDGVYDYLDKCPDTPLGIIVNENGCPVDFDKDGVDDIIDKCPNTPLGIPVDSTGCPFDTDKDGVADYLDKCQNTPFNIIVDENGCPLDSDGDGIIDSEDKCPYQAGLIYNHGCPEIKKEIRNLFKKAMTGIQFEIGKAIIKKISFPILDQIVAVLELNPEYNLSISGHTDNSGDDDRNMQLSVERANAVAFYFINKGIDIKRLTAVGFGETKPIADNNTAKGRAENRRVEFEITFEQISYETVVNPELENIITPQDSIQ